MVIQRNMLAINAVNKLNINVLGAKKSTEKISSGLRINRAGDDAAGLAVSEKMRALSKHGYAVNVSNINKGLGMLSVADGAMQEIHAINQRMRELAVASSNGTYQPADREAMDFEFQRLKSEIDRIVEYTEYNGIKIFDNQDPEITKNYIDYTMMSDTLVGSNGVEIIAGKNDTFGYMLDGVEHEFTIEAGSYSASGIVAKLNEKFALPANGGGAVKAELNGAHGNIVYKYDGHTFDGFFGNAHAKDLNSTDAVSVMYDNIIHYENPGVPIRAKVTGNRDLSMGYQITNNNKNFSLTFGTDVINIDLKELMGIAGMADVDASGNAINTADRTFTLNELTGALDQWFIDNGKSLTAYADNNRLVIEATSSLERITVGTDTTTRELFYGRYQPNSYVVYNPGFGGNDTDGYTVTLAGDKTVTNADITGVTWGAGNNTINFTFGVTNNGDVNTIKNFHNLNTTANFTVTLSQSSYGSLNALLIDLQAQINDQLVAKGFNADDLMVKSNNGRIELTSNLGDAYIGKLYGGLVDRLFAANASAGGVIHTSGEALASSAVSAQNVYEIYPYTITNDQFEGWIAGVNPTGDGNTGNDASYYKTNTHDVNHPYSNGNDRFHQHYQLYDFMLNPAIKFNGDLASKIEITAGYNDTMTIQWSEDWATNGSSTASASDSWTTETHTGTITIPPGVYTASTIIDTINSLFNAAGIPASASLTDGRKGAIPVGSDENPTSLTSEYSGALIIGRTDTPTQLTDTAGVYEAGLNNSTHTNVASKNHTISVIEDPDPYKNWFNTGINKEVYPTTSFVARGYSYETSASMTPYPFDNVETFTIDSSNNTLNIRVGDPAENNPYPDPFSTTVTITLQTGVWTIRDIEQQIRDQIEASAIKDYVYILDGSKTFTSNVPNGSSSLESGGYVGSGNRDTNYTDSTSYYESIPSQSVTLDWSSRSFTDTSLVIAAKLPGDAYTITLSGNAYSYLYLHEENYTNSPAIVIPPEVLTPSATGRLDLNVYAPIEIKTGENDILTFTTTDDGSRTDYSITLKAGSYDSAGALIEEINRAMTEAGVPNIKAQAVAVNSPVDNSYIGSGVPCPEALDREGELWFSENYGTDYNASSFADGQLLVLQLYHENPSLVNGSFTIDRVGGSASHYIFYPRPFTAEAELPDKVKLQVGPKGKTEDSIFTTDIPIQLSLKRLNLENDDISTQDNANDVIESLDKAIRYTSMRRARSGADYNSLESTCSNVISQLEHITSAESQIRDTDMAKELVMYTKYNVLQQSAQAMLAQAQESPYGVLKLLQ